MEIHKVAAVVGWMQVKQQDHLLGQCSILGGHVDSSPLTDDHSESITGQSYLFQSGPDNTFLEGGDTESVSFEILTTLAF